LDSDESTLNDFTNAGGRLPSPRKTTQGKTGGAKKKVSIKKAKGLPKYAGKPDAEIKAAIEAQGFEAIP
jgi:hypothetical protein